jgi:hypothetical protein
MATLLAEQVKKNDVQTATREACSIQAAQWESVLAQSADDVRESADSARRTSPNLPSTLREPFNPQRNNESPFGTYGTLS